MVDDSHEEDDDNYDVGDDDRVGGIDEEPGDRRLWPQRHGRLETQDEGRYPQGQHPQLRYVTRAPVIAGRDTRVDNQLNNAD